MHSHDRTLVSQLCQDSDRRSWIHEMACYFLTLPENSIQVMEYLFHDEIEVDKNKYINHPKNGEYQKMNEYCSEISGSIDFSFEYCISKGKNQYTSIIGYADCILSANLKKGYTCKCECFFHPEYGELDKRDYGYIPSIPYDKRDEVRCNIRDIKKYQITEISAGIEVKIAESPTTDAIRQIKLYKEFIRLDKWVLVTAYDISDIEKNMLSNEYIEHIMLGQGFRKWLDSQKKPNSQKKPQL